MDPPDDEYSILSFNLACDISSELAVICVNVARIQRAPKSAEHSTGGRRYHIINRSGVRILELRGIYPVMLGDGSVNAKDNLLRFAGKVRYPQRASLALNSYFGDINNFGHEFLLLF
jgi:hypothetical protein